MADNNSQDQREVAESWMRETFDTAVNNLIGIGVVEGEMAEAKPVFVLPLKLIIGQLRSIDDATHFTWVICGDLPTDHISSTVAATPRDAARHFALKWQLNAARFEDPEARKSMGLDESIDWQAQCEKVMARAEELYEIAASDDLWQD